MLLSAVGVCAVADKMNLDRSSAGPGGEEALRLAMASLDIGADCVVWLDSSLRVQYVNQAVRRTLGYASEEVMGREVAEFTHPDDTPAILEWLGRPASPGAAATMAGRCRRKSGGYCWLEGRAARYGSWVCAAATDVTERLAAEEALRRAKRDLPAAGANPRVLVVDDNRVNQRVAREMLARLGVTVETANNGREAIDAMRRGPDRFDAILMDMEMPEMGGLEATRVIRMEFPHQAVPIIAATASALNAERDACLEAGMNDYLSKPIEPKALAVAMSHWMKLPLAAPPPQPLPIQTPPSPALSVIRGVDIGSALARLNGKQELFVRLLRGFVEEHRSSAGTIASAIALGNIDAAVALVHNVKGVAGTLSATAVYEAARELEASLREGERDSLPAHVERLTAALDMVCRSTADWAGDVAPAPAPPRSASPIPQPSAVAADVAEFDRLLRNRRFAARKQFDLVREHATSLELKDRLDRIQDCLDHLDFDAARGHLVDVAMTLGVPLTRG